MTKPVKEEKMNHNYRLSLLFAIVLIVAALVAISSVEVASFAQTKMDEARSIQGDTARWEAMGEFYSKLSNEADAKQSLDAYAARWQGMGEAYLANVARGRQADTARWEAMGKFYAKQKALTSYNEKLSWDTYAARWQGIGEAYLANIERGRQADTARLQAAADAYLANIERGRQADTARWEAMAEFFMRLQE